MNYLLRRIGQTLGFGTADPPPISEVNESSDAYKEKLEKELTQYADDIDVHALPEIFHYWSNRYVRPWFEAVGATHPEDLFARYLLLAAKTATGKPRFLSIGSGNGDVEVTVARDLLSRGLEDFTIECLEINPIMLARGRSLAREAGVEHLLRFEQADFNAWTPRSSYHGVLANQCLHHVTNLEGLFDSIAESLTPKGYFISSDMIGRNGHQRWPEALGHVRRLWQELPERYRYNHQTQRLELDFINYDCSIEGFEGIRAQDILPLLMQRFSFQVFIAFGNVIDPFIDRAFGHNFSVDEADDRAFIDRVHALDEAGFADGTLKPTHMVAVMVRQDLALDTPPVYARQLGPAQAVRSSAGR
ncbi:MAG: class I SAM-dependent methyltransferase [Wenzhouxiangella sp.]|jgi:SAM-dependent methyltransferase|nr:class I SAM-dependent methyltransferase [Wenzhouxiangella sp.]